MVEQFDPMLELETAIMVALGADGSSTSSVAALAATLPGGVYSRVAGGGSYPFLTISLVRQDDDYTYTGPYRHRFRYQFSVTDAAESIDAVSAALAVVNGLLQDAVMPMPHYTLGYSRRAGRVQPPQPVSEGVSYQRIADEWLFELYANA